MLRWVLAVGAAAVLFASADSSRAASFADLPEPGLSRALDAVLMPVDAATRDYFALADDETGVVVLAVGQGGVAEVYGIRPGDVVVSVSDVPFALPDEIDTIVWALMNDRKFSFSWSIRRGGDSSTISFPLVETHFQESYLVGDIPGWPNWAEWSRRAPQAWSAYASSHLDDFERDFEGAPVCRSCGAPPATEGENAAAEPLIAEQPVDAPAEVPATEAVVPDEVLPAPAVAEPAVPAAVGAEQAESSAAPVVEGEPPVAAAPFEPEAQAPSAFVQPVPDQPMLFGPPETLGVAEDRSSNEPEPAVPDAGASAAPTGLADPVAATATEPVELARLPRPVPARPTFIAQPPEPTLSVAPAAAQEALASPPDAGLPAVDPSGHSGASFGETTSPSETDFCAQYPTTCRMREQGYGGGRDGGAGGNRGGGEPSLRSRRKVLKTPSGRGQLSL